MTRKILLILGTTLLVVMMIACKSVGQSDTDNEINGKGSESVQHTESGLQILDLEIGDGAEVQAGDVASMHYTGWLEDGTKFDSSLDRGRPFEFTLGVGNVIKGWDQGVVGMKINGKRKLTIPPELGYGTRGAGNAVPPNATLIFEVELLAIK